MNSEGIRLYRFPNKQLRAVAIKEYMEKYGYKRAVCFSCGNASAALKKAGVSTLDISERGDLQALRWFTQGEVGVYFGGMFDATSGHLPIECLLMVAERYREYIQSLPEEINLPTGSGETLVCLKLAFPHCRINAVYNLDEATKYEEGAPLNRFVELLAEKIYV